MQDSSSNSSRKEPGISDDTSNSDEKVSSPSALRVAFFVCFVNAGVTTRGVEIAKALREELARDSRSSAPTIDFRLFSWKGPDAISYESVARKAGFDDISYYGPELDEKAWTEIMKQIHSGRQLLDKDRLVGNLQGALQALRDYKPHLVVHGMFPDISVASQMLGVPHIMFTPAPFWDRAWMEGYLGRDIPDFMATWWTDLLPLWVRRAFMELNLRRRRAGKNVIYEASLSCGWKPANNDTSALHQADCYLLADRAENYKDFDFGSANVKIVGPVFAGSSHQQDSATTEELSDAMKKLLQAGDEHVAGKNKIFVTMGSSGGKEFLVEAVKAVLMGRGDWKAIVALPPSQCSTQELRNSIGTDLPDDRILLTEDFVPCHSIARQVDVVICHGGQGTVQTALAAGTPMVGTGMQWEQQLNLDNCGEACIRIPKRKWKAPVIRDALVEILERNDRHKSEAVRLRDEILRSDGARNAAEVIFEFAKSLTH
jgi:hypothetical protein